MEFFKGMSEKMSFTEDQLADFQEAFLLFDNKGDGRIPVSFLWVGADLPNFGRLLLVPLKIFGRPI
jgi:hypothetical protein